MQLLIFCDTDDPTARVVYPNLGSAPFTKRGQCRKWTIYYEPLVPEIAISLFQVTVTIKWMSTSATHMQYVENSYGFALFRSNITHPFLP